MASLKSEEHCYNKQQRVWWQVQKDYCTCHHTLCTCFKGKTTSCITFPFHTLPTNEPKLKLIPAKPRIKAEGAPAILPDLPDMAYQINVRQLVVPECVPLSVSLAGGARNGSMVLFSYGCYDMSEKQLIFDNITFTEIHFN